MASLIAFCASKKGPGRLLKSLCGVFAWCNRHSRLCFPFLYRAQGVVHSDSRVLGKVAFGQLVMALHVASIPVSKSPIKWGIDLPLWLLSNPHFALLHPNQHVPQSALTVFCDTSIKHHRLGLVVCHRSFPHYRRFYCAYSLPLPLLIGSQQTAELYAVKVAIVKFGHLSKDIVFSTDSESSLHTLNKMSTKVAHHGRSKIVRQDAQKLLALDRPSLALTFVSGLINPADLYSRLDLGRTVMTGNPMDCTWRMVTLAIGNMVYCPSLL